MTSNIAKADIETMQDEGLSPTFDDIVRLNALGLKIERCERGADMFACPRIAYCGDIQLREPTIGHGMWLEHVSKYCDESDNETMILLMAFCFSMNHDRLPDMHDMKKCRKDIETFINEHLKGITIRQLKCAVDYVLLGDDTTSGVYVESDDEHLNDSSSQSVYVGYMLQTLSLGLGISVNDICKLTISQVKSLQEMAYVKSGLDFSKI